MHTSRSILGITFFLFVCVNANAFQTSSGNDKTVQAYRLTEAEKSALQFDGKVNEDFWNSAIPASGFLQMAPVEGNPATERTEIRIAYDSEYLLSLIHI